jgi:altronate dehydratase large subunit
LIFQGYRRSNGDVGVRNHILALSIMDSANQTVRRIADMVRFVTPVTIQYGRGQYGADEEMTTRSLINLASNGNVAGVVIVSLEPVSAQRVADAVALTGKPVEVVAIQRAGDPLQAAAEGAAKVAKMVRHATRVRRETLSFAELTVGVECGGSDTTSGIASNPAVGWVADQVVDAGGRVLLSETSEILGAEHLLARRATTQDVADKLYEIVGNVEREAWRRGVDIRGANPVPDNIRGGLTTIEEKSLGAILKAGTRDVQGVLEYAERATGNGLYVMDTAAPAVESLTGLAAGGSHIILFTTGVGNSVGVKLVPVVKVSANPHTVRTMAASIDADVSALIMGVSSLQVAGKRLLADFTEYLNGARTASEILGEEDVAISKIQTTI